MTARKQARRSTLGLGVLLCAVLLAGQLSAAPWRAAPAGSDCTITGTPAADVLVGTSGDDVLCGLGGDDVLRGGPGDDRLLGGTDDDRLFGGGDNDRLVADGGDDVLDGGGGNDNLRGGVGADVFRGGPGSDLADYLNSDEALTLSIGGAADGSKGEGDNIRADVENLRGGSGNDSLQGNARENWLHGYGAQTACAPAPATTASWAAPGRTPSTRATPLPSPTRSTAEPAATGRSRTAPTRSGRAARTSPAR